MVAVTTTEVLDALPVPYQKNPHMPLCTSLIETLHGRSGPVEEFVTTKAYRVGQQLAEVDPLVRQDLELTRFSG